MHAEIRSRTTGTLLGLLQIGQALLTQLGMTKGRMMPTVRIMVESHADNMWGVDPTKLTPWTIEVGVVPFTWMNLDTRNETIHWMLAVNDDMGHIFANAPAFTPVAREQKAVVLTR